MRRYLQGVGGGGGQGTAINQWLLKHQKHLTEMMALGLAQKVPEENEISVLEATERNRESQLLPIFRPDNCKPHNLFPGVCLANTELILLENGPSLAWP